MHSLIRATGVLLEEILDQTFPLWGEGLSRAAYGQFNRAQAVTAWGTDHLERLALVSETRQLLSTAKRYDLRARVDGRVTRVLGVGAVFTPVAIRGRGFASTLITAMLDRASREGFDLALLFSAIGPYYYRQFGFELVPYEQVSLHVQQKPGSPAMLVRGGEDWDVPFLVDMHEARLAASGWRFALERDVDFVHHAIARKRLFAGLGPPGFRDLEFLVAEEGGRPAAYAVLLNTEGTRMLCECGDRDPSGARVGALLQALLARAPHLPAGSIRAWLPHGFRPPQLEIAIIEHPGVGMMVKPLRKEATITPPLSATDVMYWLGDVV